MILFRDKIIIKTTAEKLFHWFKHLDQNYLAWHPDHVSCRFLEDKPLRRGSKIYVQEYLHGKLHTFTFTISSLTPNREIIYRIMPGMKGAFRFLEQDKNVIFEAEVTLGWDIPLIGSLIDCFIRTFFSKNLQALKQHMKEESINLRALIESDHSC